MKLFGKEILVRKKSCTEDGGSAESVKPTVKLYAKVTNACNATSTERIDFNVAKFRLLGAIRNLPP